MTTFRSGFALAAMLTADDDDALRARAKKGNPQVPFDEARVPDEDRTVYVISPNQEPARVRIAF